MGMTDKQFNSYLRSLIYSINKIKERDDLTPECKKELVELLAMLNESMKD